MSDTPEQNSTPASLSFDDPGPYVHRLKNGGTITFPDPFDMDFDAASDFMDLLLNARTLRTTLRRWLTPKDYDKFIAEKYKLGEVVQLMALVNRHYNAIFGDLGELSGSATR